MQKIASLHSLKEFDFVDLGAGKGDSLASCEKRIGGQGLGIDNDPDKVKKAVADGENVVLGSALDIHKVPGEVGFVTCDNFLEHLPSFEDVDAVIKQAINVAKDFLYIRHPSFEDMEYLKGLGLKAFWTDWEVHTSMLKLADITDIFYRHGVYNIKIVPVMRIKDSDNPNILPIKAESGQHHYRPEHGPKPKPPIVFEKDVFYAFDVVALLPDSRKEMPLLEYKDRLNSDTRPIFRTNKTEQLTQKLQEDITAIKSRKSIKAANRLSGYKARVKKFISGCKRS